MAKSIIQEIEWECYLCGKKATEHHHTLNGNGVRNKADKYGLIVCLCHDCHAKVHADYELREKLKKISQEVFEEKYGHDKWMAEFHKNYL